MRHLFYIYSSLLVSCCVYAGSVEKPAVDHSPEKELASFQITPGYEVNLFASEKDQIANPIAMHFDGSDRLWVMCSLVYPQLVPTEKADDKIYILEDTDKDGVADKTTIFADGLNMPTGFAIGDGGVYVGEGTDLVFLKDTDGDDKADTREVIFSGFGTGDTHQNINSLTFSPDGELMFCQGLHAFSRVETPWGIKKMDEHGVWRMRPRRLQLDAFRGVAGQNPWGMAFGHWGEGFVKGNGTSLSELSPVAVPAIHRSPEVAVGKTAIKSMGALIVDSPALPDDIQGDILIAGYYAHVIDRMNLYPDSAGHRTENTAPLFKTDHSSFRPVDIKTGPDGAIYIADWYNPIIGHYQASLRHPDRDKIHGRIWRVTAKGKEVLKAPNVASLPLEKVVEKLGSPIRYERDRAREVLSGKPSADVVAALDKWVATTENEHDWYEAICVYAWHEHTDADLLARLHKAKDPLARAFACRIAGRWLDQVPQAVSLITESIQDPHPRVRLEAVTAAGYSEDPQVFVAAMQALDHPMDRFIGTALTQIAHYKKPVWFSAVKKGELTFKDPEHLAFALITTSGTDAAGTARTMLADPQLSSIRETLLRLLAQSRKPADQITVLTEGADSPLVLESLADAVALHRVRPKEIPPKLGEILGSDDSAVQAAAIRLAGLWLAKQYSESVKNALSSSSTEVKNAAAGSIAKLKGKGAIDLLFKTASESSDSAFQNACLSAILPLDPPKAAALAVSLLNKAEDVSPLIIPFLQKQDGLSVLAEAITAFESPVSSETASAIRAVTGKAGKYSEKLDAALGGSSPIDRFGLPEYSEELITSLAAEVDKADATNGKTVFHNGAIGCIGCHQTGNQMASLGPDLSAVGAGLPVELIIEAILWPRRQVKEGFLSSTITTKSGQVISGYIQTESRQRIDIRNAATGTTTAIAGSDIASRVDAGTLMPPGLTANLTRSELVDMVAYLTTLKGQ